MTQLKTPSETLTEIASFMERNNNSSNNFSSWYVGITDDIQRRLFQEHNVNKDNGTWIYRKCSSCSIAREIEDYLLRNYKTKGDTGGGNNSTCWVYAYKICSYTAE